MKNATRFTKSEWNQIFKRDLQLRFDDWQWGETACSSFDIFLEDKLQLQQLEIKLEILKNSEFDFTNPSLLLVHNDRCNIIKSHISFLKKIQKENPEWDVFFAKETEINKSSQPRFREWLESFTTPFETAEQFFRSEGELCIRSILRGGSDYYMNEQLTWSLFLEFYYAKMHLTNAEKLTNSRKVLFEAVKIKTDIAKRTWEIHEIKNNFDDVDIKKVYEYFKINLVDKKIISDDDLRTYLYYAFQENKIPPTLFKLNYKNKKRRIREVFYHFYKEISKNIHGEQHRYLDLLDNYFEGFKTKSSYSNFAKLS